MKIQIQKPYNKNLAHVECENKSDTSNNMGDWNHFKITQTVPEQPNGKERNEGTAKNMLYWALHTYSGKC